MDSHVHHRLQDQNERRHFQALFQEVSQLSQQAQPLEQIASGRARWIKQMGYIESEN